MFVYHVYNAHMVTQSRMNCYLNKIVNDCLTLPFVTVYNILKTVDGNIIINHY